MVLEDPFTFLENEAIKAGLNPEDLIGTWIPTYDKALLRKEGDTLNVYIGSMPERCNDSVIREGRMITSSSVLVYKDTTLPNPRRLSNSHVDSDLMREFRFTFYPDYFHIRIRDNKIFSAKPHRENPELFEVGRSYEGALLFMLGLYIGTNSEKKSS